MAAKPALVRVKRRRDDPAPENLVLESLERLAAQASDPSKSLAALALSAPASKKRRFQFVTTNDGDHPAVDDLIQQLACQPSTQDRIQRTHHNAVSAGNTATYRQVPSASCTQDNIHQHFKVYDLECQEVASPKPSQLFSGPDEASIIANYYPLVQSYLRQQQHEAVEQDAQQLQAEVSDGFVYDYYAAATDTQTGAEADLTHVPTVQVRDDEDWWHAPVDADSSDNQSEDPNAEDWYGNDYPEDDESAESLPGNSCPSDTSSDD